MQIQQKFPHEVISLIMSFVPNLKKKEKEKEKEKAKVAKTPTNTPKNPFSVSPSMERDLRVINSKLLKGKNEMFLTELEDFILD